MIEVIAFKAEHLNVLKELEETKWITAYISNSHAAALEGQESYTVMLNGNPLLCAGLVAFWPGRAEVWAIVSQEARSRFLPVQRAVKRFLSTCPQTRIEAVVDAEFIQARKWVETLGFEIENPLMRCYLPGGRDATMYVRIKD